MVARKSSQQDTTSLQVVETFGKQVAGHGDEMLADQVSQLVGILALGWHTHRSLQETHTQRERRTKNNDITIKQNAGRQRP